MRQLLVASMLAAGWLLSGGASSAFAQCCTGQPGHDHHAAPAVTAACCGDHGARPAAQTGCCEAEVMPCCAARADGDPAIAAAGLGLSAAPAVKTLVVAFRDPVRVGDALLMGRYVIEHDDARMARGEPCTHIYAFDDRREPVAAFHCTHLERPVTETATVVLAPTIESAVKRLTEFQFAGETASHGVPTVR